MVVSVVSNLARLLGMLIFVDASFLGAGRTFVREILTCGRTVDSGMMRRIVPLTHHFSAESMRAMTLLPMREASLGSRTCVCVYVCVCMCLCAMTLLPMREASL